MSEKQRIDYDTPVILVGGGDVDWKWLEYVAGKGHPVIAVDSGADVLRDAGIQPDVIIGDLDSVSEIQGWPRQTAIVEISEQDTTDFEKALYTTTAPLYLAFGFLGKRLDHSLTALHCLIKYRRRKSIVLIDCVDLTFIPTVPLVIDLPLHSRFSVNPVARVSFLESIGLRYPLDGLTLEPGVATGTSNSVSGVRVSVSPENAAGADYMVVVANTSLPHVMDWYASR